MGVRTPKDRLLEERVRLAREILFLEGYKACALDMQDGISIKKALAQVNEKLGIVNTKLNKLDDKIMGI